MDNLNELKERRNVLYQDTLDEIKFLVGMINQHNFVLFCQEPDLLVDYFGIKMAVKAILIDDNEQLNFLCLNQSAIESALFYKISKDFDIIPLVQLFDVINRLNRMIPLTNQ